MVFTTSITSLYSCQKDRGNSKHQYITSYILLNVTFKYTLHLYSPCSQRFTGTRLSILCHRNPVETCVHTCVFLNCVHPVITSSGPGSLYQTALPWQKGVSQDVRKVVSALPKGKALAAFLTFLHSSLLYHPPNTPWRFSTTKL